MIKLRIPAVIDESVLRVAFLAAKETGSNIQLETFFRVQTDNGHAFDCDSITDVKELAVGLFSDESKTTLPKSEAVEERLAP